MFKRPEEMVINESLGREAEDGSLRVIEQSVFNDMLGNVV